MNREDMLAGLIAQAALDGGDLVTLRAIVKEASEVGACAKRFRLSFTASIMVRMSASSVNMLNRMRG